MNPVKYSVTISTILLAIASISAAQAPSEIGLHFQLEPGSRISIKGTSTVNTFTCTSSFIQGSGTLAVDPMSRGGNEVKAEIGAQVKLFTCGHSRMSKDLWHALKADDHPLIYYRLNNAVSEGPIPAPGTEFPINAEGTLSIAGRERPIELSLVATKVSPTHYSVRGAQEILMSDFGVEPPTALMGLIKAHDLITVQFDLISTTTTFQSSRN